MKASIVHDEHGGIISISKSVSLKETGSKFTKVGMVPGRGQQLVEVEISGEAEKTNLRDLHRTHRIDVATSKLIKRS